MVKVHLSRPQIELLEKTAGSLGMSADELLKFALHHFLDETGVTQAFFKDDIDEKLKRLQSLLKTV